MKLSFLAIMGACAGLACVQNIKADSLDEIAAQIQYDQTHIQPAESEAQKHMAEMREDMRRRDELVYQDKMDQLKAFQAIQSGPSRMQQWQTRANNLADANKSDSTIKVADALGGAHVPTPDRTIISHGGVTEVYDKH